MKNGRLWKGSLLFDSTRCPYKSSKSKIKSLTQIAGDFHGDFRSPPQVMEGRLDSRIDRHRLFAFLHSTAHFLTGLADQLRRVIGPHFDPLA